MAFRDRLNEFAVDISLVPDRAGRYSRGLARERRLRFIRNHWPRLASAVLVGLALTGLVVLLPGWMRGFVAGVWIASVFWFVALLVVQGAGSAPTTMGALAEQWTERELRWLRHRGWKVTSHVNPSFSEVDHIALGPGCLVVIETKWVSDPGELTKPDRIQRNQDQVRAGAKLVRLSLQRRLQSAPTLCAVVYWGPGIDEVDLPVSVSDGDPVLLKGPQLRGWLSSLTEMPPVLNRPSLEDAWATVGQYEQLTDRREGAVGSKTRTRLLIELIIGILAGLLTFWCAALVLSWIGLVGLPLVVAVLFGGAVLYSASPVATARRSVGLGIFTASFMALALVGALYAISGFIHQ